MSQNWVSSFEHLNRMSHAAHALHMLQRIASLVKPIMRKHGWKLPVLAEFFPDDPNLMGLNINGGQKILLRLRPAHNPNTFLEEENVVQTMLHELTHNVHGPHDTAFYKFLEKLQEEYDAIKHSGYAGEGFFSPGRRLGAGVSHNVPVHQVREKALKAAERRAQQNKVLGSGGKLGGGQGSTPTLSPREMAARAAERRIRDEKRCGNASDNSGGRSLATKEAEKAQQESTSTQASDLPASGLEHSTADDRVEAQDWRGARVSAVGMATAEEWACPLCTLLNDESTESCSLCETKRPTLNISRPPAKAAYQTSHQSPTVMAPPALNSQVARARVPQNHIPKEPTPPGTWECNTCTLLNDPSSFECMACTTRRPFSNSDGWTCLACDTPSNSHDFWSCRACGTIKSSS